jgi:pilus assembly protein CpaE
MNVVSMMGEADISVRKWNVHHEDGSVRLVLSEAEVAAAGVLGGEIAGFGLVTHMLDATAPVPADDIQLAEVLIVEVRVGEEASLRRLLKLREEHPRLKVVAAVRDAPIPVVRTLLRSGINDVLALPLTRDDLAACLQQLREEIGRAREAATGVGKIVSIVRSVGGVGATTFATQAASLQVARDAAAGRETCLVDLDLQFGNAATYLGVAPKLTIADLIEAGSRVDRAVLRSTAAQAASGLHVIAAPVDIVPLESASTDQMFHIVDLAAREFGTVFLDLPGSWTNWSMSLVGRSDAIVLVIELTVASLRQARRQLTLLANQGLQNVPVIIVANRVQKKLFRSIDLADAERALGHAVEYSIANDFPLVSTALDQGVVIGEIKANSKVAKDVLAILDGCDTAMGR